MNFGHGAEGSAGNGYQLLMCIFLELFGVSLGQVEYFIAVLVNRCLLRIQLIGAISPSMQVCPIIFCY